MADLPGHLVAITSTCMTKLESFDGIGTQGANEFSKTIFRNDLSFFKKKSLFVNEIRASNFLSSVQQLNSPTLLISLGVAILHASKFLV